MALYSWPAAQVKSDLAHHKSHLGGSLFGLAIMRHRLAYPINYLRVLEEE
jgi:hypothetical protein